MDCIEPFDTLKTNKEYSRVYKKGISFHSNFFVIFFLNSKDKKVGFVASKKVGNAVCRNRCKRLLREVFYKNSQNLSKDSYVLIAKKSLLQLDFHKVNVEFQKVFIKMKSKKVFS